MPEKIKQYGLPRSGTNYARYLIEQNYNTQVVVDREGWKHGHIDVKLPSSRKCVIVCKNPFSWLASIYEFHSKINWSDVDVSKPESMHDFLRTNFVGYHLNSLISYKNPIACWNGMHRHWLAIQHTERKVSVLKHEDLVDMPERALTKLALELSLEELETPFVNTGNTFGRIGDGVIRPGDKPFDTKYYKNKEYLELFSTEDIEWIKDQIEIDIVNKLGYKEYFTKAVPFIASSCETIFYDPLDENTKLDAFLKQKKPKNVLIVFRHGLGDLLMFLEPFRELKEKNPDIRFDLGISKKLGQEDVCPEAIEIDDSIDLNTLGYDIISKIHFPMSEGQERYTKAEWCCIEELGIPPIAGHFAPNLVIKNKLVSVHFNITCLPGSCNPDEATAHKIWKEIIEAGYIPIESHFEHVYHNPTNKKFDFVNATIRGCKPQISTLAGLIKNSAAFIGVVSGNFHLALSVLPPKRIVLLEKEFTAPMFTKLPIYRCNIKKYIDGSILDWLKTTHP